MSADILRFPNRQDRSWDVIADALRENLMASGCSVEKTSWIIRDMEKRVMEGLSGSFATNVQVPKEAGEQVNKLIAGFTEFVHESTNQAILQIVLLESELYDALHS